jgi:hypothetical protein
MLNDGLSQEGAFIVEYGTDSGHVTRYFEIKVMIIYLEAISAKYWPMI